MNKSYFELPVNKQRNLLNAGYKIFVGFPYKKAPMIAIAEEDNSCKLFFIDKEGHNSNQDNPQRVNELINKFIFGEI